MIRQSKNKNLWESWESFATLTLSTATSFAATRRDPIWFVIAARENPKRKQYEITENPAENPIADSLTAPFLVTIELENLAEIMHYYE